MEKVKKGLDLKKVSERKKKYYIENREKILLYSNKRYSENREEEKSRLKEYYLNNKDKQKKYYNDRKDKYRKWQQENRVKNIDEINRKQREYMAKRKKENPEYKLAHTIRNRIRMGLKRNTKHNNTIELLGCSFSELKNYLELKFTEGMTWDNHGVKGWHIDHIKPISKFKISDIDEQKQCFHYTNLQPLWAIDNIKKSNKYDN